MSLLAWTYAKKTWNANGSHFPLWLIYACSSKIVKSWMRRSVQNACLDNISAFLMTLYVISRVLLWSSGSLWGTSLSGNLSSALSIFIWMPLDYLCPNHAGVSSLQNLSRTRWVLWWLFLFWEEMHWWCHNNNRWYINNWSWNNYYYYNWLFNSISNW